MATTMIENDNALKDYKIGFIGLGLMGKPMCLNLQKAGAELYIYNRSKTVLEELNTPPYIHISTSPANVAEQTNIIVIMVSDTQAVEDVLFGKQGIANTIKKGTLIIDMGTTAVNETRGFSARLKEFGADYVDSPVSGGELGAINASLVMMAGGTEKAIQRARPVLNILGNSLVHIGEVGTGQVAKAANQMIVGLTIGAVAEAFTLADQAGADLSKVREALMGGFASSRILELHGQRMIDKNFKPGGKITTQHKDLSQAIDLAREYQQQLPATELNKTLYQTLIDSGQGNLDHSALILSLETDKR